MNSIEDILQNNYVITVIALITASYAGKAVTEPSAAVKNILTSAWFRFLVIFLLCFISKKNFHLSLLIAISFVIAHSFLLKSKVVENYKT